MYYLNSLKYTIRSIIRELVRGHIFRYYYYKQISKNEFSDKNLMFYRSKRLKKIANALLWKEIKTEKIIDMIYSSPIISKYDVIKNPKKYQSRRFHGFITNYNSTSGTSGTPLKIKQSLECVHLEEAFVYRQMKWTGYRFGKRRVWLRGDMIVPLSQIKGPFWCKDYFTNTLMMSSYHISNSSCKKYIDALEKFDPYLIQAYPSSIYLIAIWMKENNYFYNGKTLKAILTSSETLNDDMKCIIEERFKCNVYDWYGQSERVAAIGTCEYGSKHLLTDYSLVELVGKENKKEIVGTSFNNTVMPLIRYKVGDYIEIESHRCKCGRVFPVIKSIYGREDKVLTLSDGREIGRLDHIFKNVNHIIEAQIIQKSSDMFVINIVTSPNYTQIDEDIILNNAKERLGSLIDITIKIKDKIPRGANGKFEFIKIEK